MPEVPRVVEICDAYIMRCQVAEDRQRFREVFERMMYAV